MNSRSRKFARVVRVLRKGSSLSGTTACSAMLRMRVITIMPGQQRQQPQQRIGPPHAGGGKACEQHGVDDELRTELFPEMRGALRERPFIRSPSALSNCALRCCVAGLAGDIAPEFAAIAQPGDRKRRRQDQIGIVVLLRARMMLQMIAAIGAGLGEDRIGAEPLAQRQVDLLVRRQAAMRAVMHQDREPELARADDRRPPARR